MVEPNFLEIAGPNEYAHRLRIDQMIHSLLIRVLVLGVALWLPFQAVAAASSSLCPAAIGDDAKNMSTPAEQMDCQQMPATNYGSAACKLCFSCVFCPASFVKDAHSSLPLKPALALGLRMPWSVVTFVTTPPEHPPHTDFLLV